MPRQSTRPRGETRPCAYCGKTFVPRADKLKLGRKLFCGLSCSSSSHGRPVAELLAELGVDDPSGCRLWQGSAAGNGYAYLRRGGKGKRVHQLSWEQASGRPVPKGGFIAHTCDRPACFQNKGISLYRIKDIHLIAYGHLVLTTNRGNVADMYQKGRNKHYAKLTEDQVRQIRSLLGTVSQDDIAARYGVSQGCVSDIAIGKNWRHVA